MILTLENKTLKYKMDTITLGCGAPGGSVG